MIFVKKEYLSQLDSAQDFLEAIEILTQLLREGKARQIYLGKSSDGLIVGMGLIKEGYEHVEISFGE